jgi:hypothetical protein
MASSSGKLQFPGATVWVSYEKPTSFDPVGCEGMHVRKVLITNAPLFLLWTAWDNFMKFIVRKK